MDYKTLNIVDTNLEKENEILLEIENRIDSNTSFFYNTGAGAGKTYALLRALSHALTKYGLAFYKSNQNVVCITYTNVAVQEIKEKLGESSIVLVSTIHERIWNILSKYQKQVLQIHIENMKLEIQSNIKFLEQNKKAKWYRELLSTQKEKDDYYKYFLKTLDEFKTVQNKPADDKHQYINHHIKNKYENINDNNVGNFFDTMKILIKIHKYQNAITNCKPNQKIEYDIRYNYDRLDKFSISHDTVLKYANAFINEYGQIKDILIDKYPIIFVDEFQDTNEHVVNFINELNGYAIKKHKKFCVGYFGDLKQSIYDTGIVSNAINLTTDYISINNCFNRRSSKEIISIANNIRKDAIVQQSIYENFNSDYCKFINEKFDYSLVNNYISQWNISETNQLHCLLMKNKDVAKYNGFESVYNAFNSYYINKYDQFSDELLSNDETKLGKAQLTIKRLIKFQQSVKNGKTLLKDILNLSKNDYTYKSIQEYIVKFKAIDGDTLESYLDSFYMVLKDDKEVISYILDDECLTKEKFKHFLEDALINNDQDKDINEILNLSINDLIQWYKYVNREFEDKSIVFQTIHSAKGLEYDNVIVSLDDNFQKKHNFFNNFFKNYNNENSLGDEEIRLYQSAQNLLYVAVTRAQKNLAVYYNYNEEEKQIHENIKKIFNIS